MTDRIFDLAGAGLESRDCKNCGTAFTPKRKWAEFCGVVCKNKYHADRRKAALEALEQVQREKREE